MIFAWLAGILWALDTIVLEYGLNHIHTALFVLPLIATCIHDTSSFFALCFIRDKSHTKIKFDKSTVLQIIASLLGGPIGMGCYMLAIHYIGANLTSSITCLYPLVGMLLGRVFLAQKLSKKQIGGIVLACLGALLLTASSLNSFKAIYILFPLFCLVAWALEGLLASLAMSDLSSLQALKLRQFTSMMTYLCIIMPSIKGYQYLGELLNIHILLYLMIAALLGTLSYLCYYKALKEIEIGRAMCLNMLYCGWVVVFSFQIPSISSLCCLLMIMTGGYLCAK